MVPPPEFVTPPYNHQKVCFLLSEIYDSYGEFLDPGLGKTKLMLDIFRYKRKCGRVQRLLVLVPNVVNVTTWIDEVAKHASDCTVSSLYTDPEAVSGSADVVVMTYAGFIRQCCSKQLKPRAEGSKKDSFSLEPDGKMMLAVARSFGMVVFDESTNIKNSQSTFYKCAKGISKIIRFRFVLTGTPFGKDPHDLWSQMNLIDWGESLGETLGIFRAAFFKTTRNWFTGFDDYVFDKTKKEHLYRCLRHRSIRYQESECFDLPECIMSRRTIEFPEEMWAYYDQLREDLKEAGRSHQLRGNVYMQMRQLTAGFMNVKDAEGGLSTIRFKENPKLDAMEELLSEFPLDQKVIVSNEFILSGEMICERLKSLKIPHVRIFSGTSKKSEVLHKFQEDPKVRVLVLNSQSGAMGLNLQVANRTVFYEAPESPITRQQMIKRTHRGGQKRTTFIYDLVVKGSIDERVLKSLAAGRSLFKDIIEGREKL